MGDIMEINAIAQRIKGIREDLEISVERMSELCGLTEKEYIALENGEVDFTFSFLNRCATIFGVDIAELLTGSNVSCLHAYTVERKGKGLKVDRREDFQYLHLASRFYNHKIDPLYVEVPFSKEALENPIVTNTHEGQEFDYVLEGGLKYMIHGQIVYLNEGDSIMFDSSSPHGMVATTENGCKFLAVVVKK
ncbi:MAG: helix-turn-helix domain-containing protein [Christensenellales bacterium]